MMSRAILEKSHNKVKKSLNFEANSTRFIHRSSVRQGVQPNRQGKCEPREYPNETNQSESFWFISQARGDSNDRVFECDGNRLDDEKSNGQPSIEIPMDSVFRHGVEESRDKKCCEELEVGRECAFREMEGTRKEIWVAREGLAMRLVPDMTVQFRERCENEDFVRTYPQHFRTV